MQSWVHPFHVVWGASPSYDAALLRWSMEAQIALAEAWYAIAPDTPGPLEAGAQYAHLDANDVALDVPSMLATGLGDCKDLVAWRVAQLRAAGEPAGFYLMPQGHARGIERWHVVTVRGNGVHEDTAALCGMPY